MLSLPTVIEALDGVIFRQLWTGEHYCIYGTNAEGSGPVIIVRRDTGRSAGGFPDFPTARDFIEWERWEDV